MRIKKLSNEAGFTLVEIMVAGAILSILMLAFSSYMYQQVKAQKALEDRRGALDMQSEISESISADALIQSEEVDLGAMPP